MIVKRGNKIFTVTGGEFMPKEVLGPVTDAREARRIHITPTELQILDEAIPHIADIDTWAHFAELVTRLRFRFDEAVA